MSKTPHILNVRPYRPRQVELSKGASRTNNRRLVRSHRHYRLLAAMVVLALVIGLGLTQWFHIRIVALRVQVDQLQAQNSAFAGENNRLMAAGAQGGSKTQVAALAKRKLHLFEPDQRQVRRM